MSTDAYSVHFVTNIPESVDIVHAEIHRNGSVLTKFDGAFVLLKKVVATPARCCEKIEKVASDLKEKLAAMTEKKEEYEHFTFKLQALLEDRGAEVKELREELATVMSELGASKKEKREHCTVTDQAQLAGLRDELAAKSKEIDSIATHLITAKDELQFVEKDKREVAANNARKIAKKNGQLAAIKKDLKTKEKEAQQHQHVITQLREEAQQHKHTVAQLTATKARVESSKKEVMRQLTVAKNDLEANKKEAQDNQHAASQLAVVKDELAATKKKIRPQQHVSSQLVAMMKKVEAAKQEAQKHQDATLSAHKDAVQAHQQRAQLQTAYEESQHTVATITAQIHNLEIKQSSLQMTLDTTSAALRAAQHDLIAARADATITIQDLGAEKKSADAISSEVNQARTTIIDLTAQLVILKMELAAYKKLDESAAAPVKSTPAPASPSKSAATNAAAWDNAQTFVRAEDEAVRRANTARAEAMKDVPQGEWHETHKATESGKGKQSATDSIQATLAVLDQESAFKDAQISSLKDGLAASKAAHSSRARETEALQAALESTQELLRDTRCELAAVKASKEALTKAACASCADTERALRHARAAADAALHQVDETHYKCMSTWSVLHDVTWDVEYKLSVRSGTPELVFGSEDGDGSASESGESVEIKGTDGRALVWDVNTPPHLRRSGFARRSLARYMPGLVTK